MEREDILDDARWSSTQQRVNNQESLREVIIETLMRKTAQQWEEIFSELAVPAARVRSINEVLSEPQLAERELMHKMPMAGSEQPAHVPGLGFKIDGASTSPQIPPPVLGQDTREILREIGIDDSTFDELARRKVVA